MRENELSAWQERVTHDMRLGPHGELISMVCPMLDGAGWSVASADGETITRGKATTMIEARAAADIEARVAGWVLL